MNKWGIPQWLEDEVRTRDTHCVYCGIEFSDAPKNRGERRSWEHIINDAKIITNSNIVLCCLSCNASKGQKPLKAWLLSRYCLSKAITENSISNIVKSHLT